MAECQGDWKCLGRTLLAAFFLLAAWNSSSFGQAQIRRQNILPLQQSLAKDDQESADVVFLPADRQSLQRLNDSRHLLEQGRYGEAVRNLGVILDGPEDFLFQPDKNSPSYHSLKSETLRLIGQMPREGLELYELQFGDKAKSLLQDALTSDNPNLLADLSRRFFHTQAGYQATLLLGLYYFDHGKPLTAALTLERLHVAGDAVASMEPLLTLTTAACWLQAGQQEKAQVALVSLHNRHPDLRMTIGGKEVSIFSDPQAALAWFAKNGGPLAIFEGVQEHNTSKTTAADGDLPLLSPFWHVPLTDDPTIESILSQVRQQNSESQSTTIPTLHPLVVNDILLMRSMHTLQAVDFSTGKRLWETPYDASDNLLADLPQGDPQARQAVLFKSVTQRTAIDRTYGTLTSDGRLVFAIEDLDWNISDELSGFRGGFPRARLLGGRQAGEEEQFKPTNRLAAYDIRTGKLKWHLGGPSGDASLRLPDTFFLGPPMVLLGQLYALAETKGEIHLMAFDAATGDFQWSQPLVVVEQDEIHNGFLQFSGITPAYADGVLICPTSSSAVVGIDLASRSLLWGYPYSQDRSGKRRVAIALDAAGPNRWADSKIEITKDCAIVSPIDSDMLYCLNLADGSLRWKISRHRHNDLYLAGIVDDNAVLIGRRGVRAIQMSSGKSAWNGKSIDFPKNSTPSGHGIAIDNYYYLPLSNAEIACLDLKTGKIVRTAKSQDGGMPGNLVAYGGKILSQGLGGVDAFFLLDTLRDEIDRRLAANPDDAEAMTLQGEMLLHAGNRAQSVAIFRKAIALQPTERSRELLRQSLLDGLKNDFAVYSEHSDEIERLLDTPEQRADFLRLMGEGLRKSGQWLAAFDTFQKVLNLDSERMPLDVLDKQWTVRRDHWFQGRMANLRAEADAASVEKIDAIVAQQMQKAIDSKNPASLERFLNAYGNIPIASKGRDALARQLRESGQSLYAELITGNLDKSPAATPQATSWPIGEVKINKTLSKSKSINGYTRYYIPLQGTTPPELAGIALYYDDTTRLLWAKNALGQVQWRLPLVTSAERQSFIPNRETMAAQAVGRLLLVSLGSTLIALDTSNAGHNNSPRILWTRDLSSSLIDSEDIPLNMINAQAGMLNMPWRHLSQSSDYFSSVGPVTSDYLCFRKSRNLTAIDPRTGETLWSRREMSPNTELFGDRNHLFMLSSDQEEASLLRPTDGEILGARQVPRISGRQTLSRGEEHTVYGRMEDYCLTTIGRQMLLWWPNGENRTLTLIDPLEQRDLWPERYFANDSQVSVVEGRAVGVLEPDGHFMLVGLPDGRTIADVRLQVAPSMIDITLSANGDQYFLLIRNASGELNDGGNIPMQPMWSSLQKPIKYGFLYAFDRDGNLQWPEPTVIRDQFMLLEQPPQLPILVFACQVYDQKNDGQQRMLLLCVDKRTGRKVYRGYFINHTGLLDISGDPNTNSVEFTMQQIHLQLTFTDNPLPPREGEDEPPKSSEEESSQGKSLWKSMQRIIGGMMEDPNTQKPKENGPAAPEEEKPVPNTPPPNQE